MSTISLSFDNCVSSNKYFMMEVDDEALTQFKSSELLTVKEPNESYYSATLHTKECSYSLLLNEVSNSYLLVNQNSEGKNVISSVSSSYINCTKIKPNYYRILSELSKHTWIIGNSLSIQKGISKSQFLKLVQISEKELNNFIESNLSIMEIEKVLYLAQFDSQIKLIEEILIYYKNKHTTEVAYPLISITQFNFQPKQANYATLNEIADYIDPIWKLNPGKIALFAAKLLFNAKSQFKLSEFIVAHKSLFASFTDIPYSALNECGELIPTLPLGFLKSHAYIIWDQFYKTECIISSIDNLKLSFNCLERINKLNELKEQWTANEIEDLLRPLINDNTITLEGIMSKYYKSISVANPLDKQLRMGILIKKSFI